MIYHTCYVGIGSNLEDPKQQVLCAIQELAALKQTQLLARSSLYVTKSMGPITQPNMINAVVALQTSLTPQQLHSELQHIEYCHGRQRIIHWGPRTLDLDLLLFANVTQQDPQLTLPHLGLLERDFVLVPLAEIAPNLLLSNGNTAQQQTSLVEKFIIGVEEDALAG